MVEIGDLAQWSSQILVKSSKREVMSTIVAQLVGRVAGVDSNPTMHRATNLLSMLNIS